MMYTCQAVGAKSPADRDLAWQTVWKAAEFGKSFLSVRIEEHTIGDACPPIQLPVLNGHPVPHSVVQAHMAKLGPGDSADAILKLGWCLGAVQKCSKQRASGHSVSVL
jgi:hypothetical protein